MFAKILPRLMAAMLGAVVVLALMFTVTSLFDATRLEPAPVTPRVQS